MPPPIIRHAVEATETRNSIREQMRKDKGVSYLTKRDLAVADLETWLKRGYAKTPRDQADVKAYIAELKKLKDPKGKEAARAYRYVKARTDAFTGYNRLQAYKSVGIYPPDLYRGHR
jgi:hypothetical protein